MTAPPGPRPASRRRRGTRRDFQAEISGNLRRIVDGRNVDVEGLLRDAAISVIGRRRQGERAAEVAGVYLDRVVEHRVDLSRSAADLQG